MKDDADEISVAVPTKKKHHHHQVQQLKHTGKQMIKNVNKRQN